MRPPTAKLMFSTSCSDRKAPETRSASVSYAGLDGAGGLHDVLRLQRGDQRGAIDAEAGELLHRELDEDLLVLRAQDLDLGDVRERCRSFERMSST